MTASSEITPVGGGSDLAQEPLGADHRGQLGLELLDGDLPVVAEIVREVDRCHAAGPELALEAVATGEGGREPGRGACSSRVHLDIADTPFSATGGVASRPMHLRLLLAGLFVATACSAPAAAQRIAYDSGRELDADVRTGLLPPGAARRAGHLRLLRPDVADGHDAGHDGAAATL